MKCWVKNTTLTKVLSWINISFFFLVFAVFFEMFPWGQTSYLFKHKCVGSPASRSFPSPSGQNGAIYAGVEAFVAFRSSCCLFSKSLSVTISQFLYSILTDQWLMQHTTIWGAPWPLILWQYICSQGWGALLLWGWLHVHPLTLSWTGTRLSILPLFVHRFSYGPLSPVICATNQTFRHIRIPEKHDNFVFIISLPFLRA